MSGVAACSTATYACEWSTTSTALQSGGCGDTEASYIACVKQNQMAYMLVGLLVPKDEAL